MFGQFVPLGGVVLGVVVLGVVAVAVGVVVVLVVELPVAASATPPPTLSAAVTAARAT